MAKDKKRYQTLRGFYDLLPEDKYPWDYVATRLRELTEEYGFESIQTPTLESTDLFVRSVGDTTDVVQKEMYSFEMGPNKTPMTLRPEITAGVTRAVLQNGLLNGAFPIKLQYNLSCFRHEAPQAGRQREFHQFGVECYGSPSPLQDAEIMAMVQSILAQLGVQGIQLYINSIGCPVCRPGYNKKLVDYYTQHLDNLCDDCKNRLETNPLRLLDCKEESCAPIKAKAPAILDSLCEDCDSHHKNLISYLDAMGIAYAIDKTIVRGLDYYTKTVFEFITTQIGAQGTVCGGGRYDGLMEQLGGPPTPGVGFGLGMERLMLVLKASGAPVPTPPLPLVYIGSMGNTAATKALALTYELRKEGIYALCDTMGRSVRAQMKYADKKQASYSCILGDNELAAGEVEINNMESGETKTIPLTAPQFISFFHAKAEENILRSLEGYTLD